MTSVLIGTADGLYRADEHGAEPVGLAGRVVNALAADDNGYWALLDARELVRDDGDGTWQPVAVLRVLRATCVHPVRADVLVGTSEAHLLRLSGDRLVPLESFDAAPGRDTWYTPWGGPPDTRSIATNGQHVYVNVHVGGIMRAGDPDGMWQPTIDIDADVHQVHVADGRVLAATAHGLARSHDAGDSWEHTTEGLDGRYLRAVATGDDTVIVTASTGPSGRRAGVYRLDAGADAFERCRAGLPEWFSDNIDTGSLDAAGSTAVFATVDGDCYASTDHARTWTAIAGGLPEARCVSLLK